MGPEIWVSVLAVVVAFGSLLVAAAAARRARDSNAIAERALSAAHESNDIAANALELASDANRIAEHANRLFERQTAQRVERHDVEWVVDEHEKRSPSVVLRNRGRDTAHDVTVAFRARDLYQVGDALGDVAADSDSTVLLPAAVTERFGEQTVMFATEDFTSTRDLVQTVDLELRWASILGNPHQQTVQVRVS